MPRFVTAEGRLMEREVSTGGGSSGMVAKVGGRGAGSESISEPDSVSSRGTVAKEMRQ